MIRWGLLLVMIIKNIQDIKRPEGTVAFVTGVTGQDGSHMVDYLLRETNVSVIGGARRLSVENHVNIRHLENEPRFQLVNFDLTDSHSIYKIIEFAKPDYFINFAAQSFVASSWDFARQTWEANSTSVLDCLEAIKRLRPSCRFYNAGSSEEFGNVAYAPQDEKHPAKPRSPYGASKCAARTLIKVYRESYGLYAVQGWLFNHEGPRRGEEFVTRKITSGIAKIFDQIVNGDEITPLELGNVHAERDWSDAEDMVDAVWKMVNQTSTTPKDYVVSSDEKHSIKEFVEKAFDVVGIKGEWSGTGLDEQYTYKTGPSSAYENVVLVKVNPKYYRPAEVDVLLGNSSLIRKDLGWKPKITFEDLIDKMVSNDLTRIDALV